MSRLPFPVDDVRYLLCLGEHRHWLDIKINDSPQIKSDPTMPCFGSQCVEHFHMVANNNWLISMCYYNEKYNNISSLKPIIVVCIVQLYFLINWIFVNCILSKSLQTNGVPYYRSNKLKERGFTDFFCF